MPSCKSGKPSSVDALTGMENHARYCIIGKRTPSLLDTARSESFCLNKMDSVRLTGLPDEVIQNVLFRLDFTNALALEATCWRFRDVANEPLLWKSFCRDGWKKWHPRHQFKAKLAGNDFAGWKALFAERTRASRETRALVAGILAQDLDRIPKIERIVELGWDAKDALLDGFHLAHLDERNVLAQRWDSDRPSWWQDMVIDW